MESHDEDPRAPNGGDPWREAGERLSELTDRLRERYRTAAGEDAPSEDQVHDALATLGGAARVVVESVGSAVGDPEVRARVKDAAAGFVAAIGETLGQLGDELRRQAPSDEEE